MRQRVTRESVKSLEYKVNELRKFAHRAARKKEQDKKNNTMI
jgi:hypothetical protein